MNIFEELAESYTYNGVVSLKALEDDIVTLENQIDSFNATLKEIQLRGKKPAPLIGKIRDAKIRLSLLKAVYKRESDKATPDDVILNMLGVSANNAKEVPEINTAADGREPKPQNFESTEIEQAVDESLNTGVKIAETDKVIDNEAVITEEDDTEMQVATLQDDVNEEITISDTGLLNEEIGEVYAAVKSEGTVMSSEPDLMIQPNPEQEEKEAESINSEVVFEEAGIKNIEPAQNLVETEAETVNVEETAPENESKPIDSEQVSTEDAVKVVSIENTPEETGIISPTNIDGCEESQISVQDEVPVDNETDESIISTDKFDVEADCFVSEGEKIEEATENNEKSIENEDEHTENIEIIPAPTLDDYMEPESGPSYEEVTYDKDGVVYNYEDEPELPEIETGNIRNAITHDIPGEVVISEDDARVYKDVPAYDAFFEAESKIYASFDLSSYTDMINTDSVKGMYSSKPKTIEVTFTDMRDYDIFLKLSNERLENECFLKRLFKKPKSIFMVVYEKIGDERRQHRFEFTGCRVVDTMDTEHTSLRDSVYYGNNKHECYARFKYKKLKIE